jgi:hypothetical protein
MVTVELAVPVGAGAAWLGKRVDAWAGPDVGRAAGGVTRIGKVGRGVGKWVRLRSGVWVFPPEHPLAAAKAIARNMHAVKRRMVCSLKPLRVRCSERRMIGLKNTCPITLSRRCYGPMTGLSRF